MVRLRDYQGFLLVMNLIQQMFAQVQYIQFEKSPQNITVVEDTDVVVPCVANTTLFPSWVINGTTYSGDTGLPPYFFINSSALRIPSIATFLNNTVVQCFFVQLEPNVGFVKILSDVGVITVIKASKPTISFSMSVSMVSERSLPTSVPQILLSVSGKSLTPIVIIDKALGPLLIALVIIVIPVIIIIFGGIAAVIFVRRRRGHVMESVKLTINEDSPASFVCDVPPQLPPEL